MNGQVKSLKKGKNIEYRNKKKYETSFKDLLLKPSYIKNSF